MTVSSGFFRALHARSPFRPAMFATHAAMPSQSSPTYSNSPRKASVALHTASTGVTPCAFAERQWVRLSSMSTSTLCSLQYFPFSSQSATSSSKGKCAAFQPFVGNGIRVAEPAFSRAVRITIVCPASFQRESVFCAPFAGERFYKRRRPARPNEADDVLLPPIAHAHEGVGAGVCQRGRAAPLSQCRRPHSAPVRSRSAYRRCRWRSSKRLPHLRSFFFSSAMRSLSSMARSKSSCEDATFMSALSFSISSGMSFSALSFGRALCLGRDHARWSLPPL